MSGPDRRTISTAEGADQPSEEASVDKKAKTPKKPKQNKAKPAK
jgi:hypothetical protein